MNESPRFLCEECGFLNVELAYVDGTVGAYCSECGETYVERDAIAINTDE